MLFNTVERNNYCDHIVDRVDAGSGAGKIRLFVSDGGTLLAELPFSTTAFSASGAQGTEGGTAQPATVGKAWVNTPADVKDETPAANGTVGYATVTDSDDTIRWSCTPGVTGSGAPIELNTLSVQTTVAVTCTNGSITCPAGSLT